MSDGAPARGWQDRARRVVVVTLVSVAVAVWGTWPIVTCLDHCVVDASGLSDGWIAVALQRDVDLIVWILAWGAHALATGPSALFEANLFHPAPHALATTEHLLGLQLLYLPLRLATGDPLAAHQATLVATFAAAFAAMLVLVRRWTGSWAAGVVAGLLYAFSPLRAQNLPALQMESGWLLPLVLLAAERVLAGARPVWMLVLAGAVALQALSSYYLGYTTALVVAVVAGTALADRSTRPYAWRLVAGAGAGLAIVAACSVPYLLARGDGGLGAPSSAYVVALSARPGKTGATPAVLLALATLPWWRRGLPASRRPLWLGVTVLVGVVAHLLALGPELRLGSIVLPGPFAAAAALVPGWSLVRAPSRLNIATTLAASVLAGVGVAGLARRAGPALGRVVLAAGLAAALVSAHVAMRWPVPLRRTVPTAELPPVYRWLRAAPAGPVLELPFHDFFADPDGLATEALRLRASVEHWRPVLGGYSGYVPPSYALVSNLARALPAPEAFAWLQRATGVRWIVLHRAELDRAARRRWRHARASYRTVAVVGRDVVVVPRERRDADLEPALRRGTAATSLGGAPLATLPAAARTAVTEIVEALPVVPGLEPAEVGVRVTNTSAVTWPVLSTTLPHVVTLGYRWKAADGRIVASANRAGRLAWDVAPGATIPARVAIIPPGGVGPLTLEIGPVQDDKWFTGTATQCFEVTAGKAADCPTP
jgi:hypothetical protein